MRTSYVPRDAPESATNASSEIHDSIRVLNFTRSGNDIIEGTMSHTSDNDNSLFQEKLSNSRPLNYIPSLTIIVEKGEMVEEYTQHNTLCEYLVSLSHNYLDVATEDVKQFVTMHALK